MSVPYMVGIACQFLRRGLYAPPPPSHWDVCTFAERVEVLVQMAVVDMRDKDRLC